MRKTTGWMVGIAMMGAVLTAVAAETDRALVLTLTNAVDGTKPLQVYAALRDGKPMAMFATGYNGRPHDADFSSLRVEGGKWNGEIRVTINPDPWLPADGKPFLCAYMLDMTVRGAAAMGSYKGRFGDRDCQGAVTGTVSALPDDKSYRRFRIRIPGALRRYYLTRGPNWKYALDMNLTFPRQAGKIENAKLETIVPDYRRYQALVKSCDLQLDGHSLTGVVYAVIDSGEQGAKGKAGTLPREELYRFAIRASVIGDVVGGSCDIQVGDVQVKDEKVLGAVSYDPPPAAAKSLCMMRLHKAVTNDGPVILNLSLSDKNPIHGSAWVPSENHQPHTVDATGLKLAGDALAGEVKVTIVPDVYRKGSPIEVRYRIEAKVLGEEVAGRFSGEDRGGKREGEITGELRARAAEQPVKSLENLGLCELNMGYCLVGGALPQGAAAKDELTNNAIVQLRYRNGKLEKAYVLHPKSRAPLDAKVEAAELRIEGDRLTGSVSFTLKAPSGKSGLYRYTLEAVISGDQFGGYWRGTLDGEPVLTKSSKLHGTLTPAK